MPLCNMYPVHNNHNSVISELMMLSLSLSQYDGGTVGVRGGKEGNVGVGYEGGKLGIPG